MAQLAPTSSHNQNQTNRIASDPRFLHTGGPCECLEHPGHMLSGIIAYQVLQQKNPPTIERVKAVLEKHPWYANQ